MCRLNESVEPWKSPPPPDPAASVVGCAPGLGERRRGRHLEGEKGLVEEKISLPLWWKILYKWRFGGENPQTPIAMFDSLRVSISKLLAQIFPSTMGNLLRMVERDILRFVGNAAGKLSISCHFRYLNWRYCTI